MDPETGQKPVNSDTMVVLSSSEAQSRIKSAHRCEAALRLPLGNTSPSAQSEARWLRVTGEWSTGESTGEWFDCLRTGILKVHQSGRATHVLAGWEEGGFSLYHWRLRDGGEQLEHALCDFQKKS